MPSIIILIFTFLISIVKVRLQNTNLTVSELVNSYNKQFEETRGKVVDVKDCVFTDFLHGKNKTSKRCEVTRLKNKYPYGHTYIYEGYDCTERADQWAIQKKFKNMKNKYYLSILSMFKNEAAIMKEWLDHHLAHGVEHFYLIDDFSTDNVLNILLPYIEKGVVSVHAPPSLLVPYRQVAAYHKAFSYNILPKNESR
jgi:hypothetical protein